MPNYGVESRRGFSTKAFAQILRELGQVLRARAEGREANLLLHAHNVEQGV